MKRFFVACSFALAGLVTAVGPIAQSASAQEWATLKVKIVYDGDAPKLKPLDATKEPTCSAELPDERMIVGKNGELANVAFIMDMKKSKAKDIHPDLAEPPKTPIIVDNKDCMFIPHMVFVRTGQTVVVTNNDNCGHNAKMDPFSNDPFNQIVPIGGKVEVSFAKPERSNTTKIACSIHPWMQAHLIIRDHPYVGISDEDGVLVIEKLPVGSVTFKMIHENAVKSLDGGKLDGKKKKWSRGAVKLDLKPGMNDLGTITLDPKLFRK